MSRGRVRKKTRSRISPGKKKSISRKWGIQTRLSIIGIVLTIIVGIWVPLSINNSNQQFQDEMVNTFIKLQKQSASATLELRSTCSSDPFCTDFEVINLGPGIAKNLTSTISLTSQQGVWKSLIKNIGQFTVQTTPSTLPVIIRSIYPGNTSDSKKLELSLDNLAPGEAFQFEMKPVNELISRWLTLNDKDISASTNFFDYVSSHGLDQAVVDFDMNARCDTCIGMKRQLHVSFSPLSSWMKASRSVPSTYQSFISLIASRQYQRAYAMLGLDLQMTTPYSTFLQDMKYMNKPLAPGCSLDRSVFLPHNDAVTWQTDSSFQCSPSSVTQTGSIQQSYDLSVQMRMEADHPAISRIDITLTTSTVSGP